MRTILIDGDIVVYRCAWVCEKTIYTHTPSGEFFDTKTQAENWLFIENGGIPEKGRRTKIKELWVDEDWEKEEKLEPWKNCKRNIDLVIGEILNECKGDDYKVFLSPSKCFRHDIATVRKYKDRKQPKPKHYERAREYLRKAYKAEVGDDIEADDLLGIHQTTDTVIASIDKDLLQIPGKHYNFVDKKKILVDKIQGDKQFLKQWISGDSTDCIPGLPGVGETKAQEILDMFENDHRELIEHVYDLYEEAYGPGSTKIAEEMAALVWILHRGEEPDRAGWKPFLFNGEYNGNV